MAKLSKALEIFVSISWYPSFLVGGASDVFPQLAVEIKWRSVLQGRVQIIYVINKNKLTFEKQLNKFVKVIIR